MDDEYDDEYDINEERGNGDAYYDNNLHVEDCEVFQCSVASLGRKAYGLVKRFRNF